MLKAHLAHIVVRRTCAVRRKISLLKYVKIGKLFEEKVFQLVDLGVQIFWDISPMGFYRCVGRRG